MNEGCLSEPWVGLGCKALQWLLFTQKEENATLFLAFESEGKAPQEGWVGVSGRGDLLCGHGLE